MSQLGVRGEKKPHKTKTTTTISFPHTAYASFF
jgi:hypothetical protein